MKSLEKPMMEITDLVEGDLVVARVITDGQMEFRKALEGTCAIHRKGVCEDSLIFQNA